MADTELKCTCPSGGGSLRWPCPSHPPEAAASAAAFALPPLPEWIKTADFGPHDWREVAAAMQAYACAALGANRAPVAAASTELHGLKTLDTQINTLRRRRDSLPVQYSERFDLAVEIDKLEARRKEMTVETEVLAGAVWKAPISTSSQVDPRQATPPGRWSEEVPTEAGHYWHWNGRQESRPVLMVGMYAHHLQQLVGAGGEPLAMLCGYWWRVYQPPVSSALTLEYKAAQAAKNENASVMLANLSKPVEE